MLRGLVVSIVLLRCFWAALGRIRANRAVPAIAEHIGGPAVSEPSPRSQAGLQNLDDTNGLQEFPTATTSSVLKTSRRHALFPQQLDQTELTEASS